MKNKHISNTGVTTNHHHHNHTKAKPTEPNQSTLHPIIHQNTTINTPQPHKSEPPSLRLFHHPSTTIHHPIINTTKLQTPISPETHAQYQHQFRSIPIQAYKRISEGDMHVDGGANAHIFRDQTHFWKYIPLKSMIQQVTGTTAPVKGMGIVPITLKGSYKIHLLYPCYHMPHNPQDTLGLTAFKYYNDMKMVRLEALSWLKFETNDGDTFRTHTLTKYHKAQLLDYVTVQIHHPKTEPTMLTNTINFANTDRK